MLNEIALTECNHRHFIYTTSQRLCLVLIRWFSKVPPPYIRQFIVAVSQVYYKIVKKFESKECILD